MLRNTLLLLLLLGIFLVQQVHVTAQTCTGNATAVTSQTGVTNPTNATGAANSTNALMYDNADVIVLDLGVYLEVGATYTIRWKKNAGTTDPSMLIEESYDATTFTANGTATTVSSTSYVNTNKTVGISLMRYVRITSQNAGDLDLDAITFSSAPCSNCNVTVVSAVPTACSNAKYNLAVTVNYTDPPGGNIVVAVGEGPGTLFTFTPDGTSPDTYTISNLTASNVSNIDVKAYFANHPNCTHTLVNAFNAPASCGNYCSGTNLLANPSFEITSANVTPPPTGVDYTPASWVAPARAYADYGWLRPDGIGHIGLYGTGTSIAYQNVPVTVGNSYSLTLYSAMHFPLVNTGTATLQYYNASNVAVGGPVVHTVTHDWEDDHGFGGPYTISLGAAPATASYVRVTLENKNPTASGESVKFDALCLTSSVCTVTGCDVVVNPVRITMRTTDITTPDTEGRTFQTYTKYGLGGLLLNHSVGISNTNAGAPNGTSSATLYQNTLYESYFDWHFAVPNGSYTVLLHFADGYASSAGDRKFDIFLEDALVANDFDIIATAGSNYRAVVRSYTSTVSDGDLALRFESVVGSVLINGIEIIPNFCTATQSVSISKMDVSGCYLNGSGQSKSTVSVEVAWNNALPRDSIAVTLGAQTKWIYPGQYATTGSPGIIRSPQVVAFEIDANGAAGTVTATMFNNNDCNTTANFTAPAACPVSTCTAGQLGGKVFYDYDDDGIKDAGETFGASGVTVSVYDCNGTVTTATTDINGNWKIASALTYPVRVEYSNLPSFVGSGGTFNGTDGRTTVQFINAADCSVDLGVLVPTDYCATNPELFTPCYVSGLPNTSSPADVLVKFNYDATGNTSSNIYLADKSEIGSVWGLAYDRKQQKIYAGAFLKRHVGLKEGLATNPAGAIYRINPDGSGTPTLFAEVSNPGTVLTNAARGLPAAPTTPSHDSLAFSQVGKVGLGDVEINANMDTLYTMNLNTKSLVIIPINTDGTAGTQVTVAVPNPCGTASDSRPFALKYFRGFLYVGVTCSGESTGNEATMRVAVYKFNPQTNAFLPGEVYNSPLNYHRGLSYSTPTYCHAAWNAWTTNFFSYINCTSSYITNPQPLLSNIEFDGDGDMILGIMDRAGHQYGWGAYSTNTSSTTLYNCFSAGDVLRLCTPNNGGSFVSEGTPGCPSNAANNQGPFGGEYYYSDMVNLVGGTTRHDEIGVGGLALLPGKSELAMTVYDPIDNQINEGGVIWMNNTSGAKTDGYRIYGNVGGTFGKAAGLGDLELICGSAPIQIGNRIWVDSDQDGVQDACESALPGVKVRLYKGTTLIAETTTDASGEYYFSSASKIGTGTWSGTGADTTLLASTAYNLVFGKSTTDQWSGPNNQLTVSGTNYMLTTANSTANNGNDLNDSDAAEASVTGIGIYPMISVTTGSLGSVNHTYDVGLFTCPTPVGCQVAVNPVRVTMRTTDITTPDTEGRTFLSYQKFDLPGNQLSNTNTITNLNTGAPNGTSSQELYRNRLAEDYIDWHFAVPNGSYTVLLHYAEGGVNAANARLFDVYIENTKVENNFDTWVQAGNAQNRALVKSYSTTVADNDLSLRFEREVNTIVVRGVEIIPNFCTATQSVSITNVDVSGCYRNGSGQSKSTVSVEVAWDNALARDSIQVTLGGQTKWIFPGQYNTTGGAGTIVSPQVVAFEVDANGSAGTVTATMFNNNDCSDTEPFTAPAACPATTCTAGQLGGTVFNDYDADGVKDTGETNGASGVTVTVFDCIGNTATATTDSDGKWVVSSALTYPVRVEYSNLPSYLGDEGTPNGTDGRTTVQFVSAADCNVDLGVLNPSDYCQDAPNVFLPCYVNGDPLPGGSAAGAMDAFVRLTYGATGLTPTITHVANASEVGSLWGVAYDKKRNKVYSSAILRRHSGLGPLGLGGIYQTNATTNATTTLVDVQGTLGVNLGGLSGGPFSGVTNTNRGLLADPTQPTHDSLALSLIGKVGFGDLEISEDNDNLYFVNLYAKTLCRLDLTGGSPVLDATFAIPSPCVNGNARPFALKVKEGVVYVGVVCDGATSQSSSDMRAYVYGFDEATSTFSAVFDFPLTYPKGYPDHSVPMISNWNAWADDFEKLNSQTSSGANLRVLYPQPILSDIEVDIDGSMLMAFADRTGLQTGANNYAPATSNTTLYSGYAGGDILRAAKKGNAFILESNAYVGGITGANPNNNQGPGFGEFYNDDFYSIYATGKPTHSEIALGALALKPGSGHSLFTVMDPIDSTVNSAGFRYISNMNGSSPSGAAKGALIYQSVLAGGATPATFSKSVGLGDMELTCATPTYLQIGNYVWIDTDQDGVQDACESALPGVAVSLYKMDGTTTTLIATTTTNSSGEYYFLETTGTQDTLETGKMYFVVIGEGGQFNTSNNILTVSGANYVLTSQNTGQGINPDLNDSDAFLYTTSGKAFTGYPVDTITIGAAGSVNHTLDFGLKCIEPDLSVIPASVTVCAPVSVNLATAFTLTDALNTTAANGYPKYYSTQSDAANDTNPLGSSTVTSTGNYWIRKNTTAGCWDTVRVTVVLNSLTAAIGSDQTICSGGDPAAFTNSSTGSGTLTYQWQSSTTSCAAGFADISMAISATYDPPSGLTQTTFYRAVVTSTLNGVSCTATSNCATITVNPNPDLTARDTSICTGNSVDLSTLFSANAVAGTVTFYENFADAQAEINAIGSTVSPPSTDEFFVRKETAAGCFDIDSVDVLVFSTQTISLFPTDSTICPGGSFVITATPSGGLGTCDLQWQYLNGATWTDLAGETAATLNTGALTQTRLYRVRYTCPSCQPTPVYSSPTTVTVVSDPTAGLVGNAVTVCTGGGATLQANVSGGSGTPSYQWQSSTDGLIFTNILGETTTELTVAGLTDTMFYRMQVNFTGAGCDAAISGVGTINVVPDPAIDISGADSVCVGQTVTLTATTFGGTGTCTIQWQEKIGVIWSNIAGATNPTYTTDPLTANKDIRARLICTGGNCDVAISDTAHLVVYPIPDAGADVLLSCPPGGGGAPSTHNFNLMGTWQIIAQPAGAAASVNGSGLVTSMTEVGEYEFQVTVNGCSDTVKITVPECCPVPECIPIMVTKF